MFISKFARAEAAWACWRFKVHTAHWVHMLLAWWCHFCAQIWSRPSVSLRQGPCLKKWRGHTEHLKSSGFRSMMNRYTAFSGGSFSLYTCAQGALSHPGHLQTLKDHTHEVKSCQSIKDKALAFLRSSPAGGGWPAECINHFGGGWLKPKCAPGGKLPPWSSLPGAFNFFFACQESRFLLFWGVIDTWSLPPGNPQQVQ